MKIQPINNEGYNLFHEGCIALSQVESNGIHIDTKYLDGAIEDVGSRIRNITKELKHFKVYKIWRKRFGSRTNLGSREQLAKILFDDMKYECHSYTSGGKTGKKRPQADEENLKSTGSKFVDLYLRLEKLKKAKGTYLEGIKRETVDGFCHPNFPLHLVSSYRGSSFDPNFHNQPRKDPEISKLVRTAFIARKNHRIIELDFKGAEVCCSACYNLDPQLIKYIKNKKLDMHRDMAIEIYMLDKDEVIQNLKHYKMARDSSKNRFVFAEFYGDWYKNRAPHLWKAIDEFGLTIKSTGQDFYSHLKSKGITELGECNPDKKPKRGTFEYHLEKIEHDFWYNRFKVYTQWKKDWYNAYLEDGYFETLTGFRIAGMLDRKQVINFPVQGSAFHWLLWCLIRIQKLLKKYKMKSLIVGQIHDSIVSDVYKDETKDYLQLAKQVIQEELRKHYKWIIVPITVEAEITPRNGSWYEKQEIEL